MIIYCDEINCKSILKILPLLRQFPQVKDIVLLDRVTPGFLFGWFAHWLKKRGIQLAEKEFFNGHLFYEDGESVMSRTLKVTTEMSFKEAKRILAGSKFLSQLNTTFKCGTIYKILAHALYHPLGRVISYAQLVEYFELLKGQEAILVVAGPPAFHKMNWPFPAALRLNIYTPWLFGGGLFAKTKGGRLSFFTSTKAERLKRTAIGAIARAIYLILSESFKKRNSGLSCPQIPHKDLPSVLMLQDDEISTDPSYRGQPHWLWGGLENQRWRVLIVADDFYQKFNQGLDHAELAKKDIYLITQSSSIFFRAWRSNGKIFDKLRKSCVGAFYCAFIGSAEEKLVLSDFITVLFKALALGVICQENNISAFVSAENYKPDTEAMRLIADDLGVTTVSFQYSNQGYLPAPMVSTAHVLMTFSPFFHQVWNKNEARPGRLVDIGYIYSGSVPYVRSRAKNLRDSLQKNGAEFILCYFDENFTLDKFGFCSQQEQIHEFELLFRLVLEDPTVGLVLKTQYMFNLPEHLKILEPLRQKAIATGRYVELKHGTHRNRVFPAEAALAGDMVIGHHTGATAPLEGALLGKRTVLINSCGRRNIQDALYARSRIVYPNLEGVLKDLQGFRNQDAQIANMGDWSLIIKEFDPFLDEGTAGRFRGVLEGILHDKSNQKIVVFENISWSNFGEFKRWAKARARISVFDWEFKTKQKKYLKPFLDSGQLHRIYISSCSQIYGPAIDLCQGLLGFIEKTGLYRSAAALYATSDVSFLFRRGLAEEIYKFFYMQDHLTKLAKASPGAEIIFISEQYTYVQKFLQAKAGFSKPLPEGIRVVHDHWQMFKEIVRKTMFQAAAVVYVSIRWLASTIGALSHEPFAPATYAYGVLVGSYIEVEHSGDRGYDFMIDDKQFTVQNTVFIDQSGLPEALVHKQERKGRFFIRVKKDLNFQHLVRRHWDTAFFASLFKSLGQAIWAVGEPSTLWRVYFICVQRYCDWNLVLQKVDFKKLIFTNQENIQTCAVNLLLRQKGKQSWNYSCFLGGAYFLSRNRDASPVRHVLWSFLVYDYFAGFNNEVIAYYKMHHQNVGNYFAIGSLYGQLIRQKMTPQMTLDLWTKYFPHITQFHGKKIIGVFDTSFIEDQEWTSLDDGIHFYEDMLRFVCEYEQCYFIFKPSKSPTFYCHPDFPISIPRKGKRILDLWRKIKAHPRVSWPMTLEITARPFLDFSNNNTIIAGSDLIITHCMSSPTAEALSAGKKAFWYESGHKHAGIDYDKIPGLIIHGYNDLDLRVQELLAMSDEEYAAYLNAHIRGRIDNYLDGKALNRFKDLISGAADG